MSLEGLLGPSSPTSRGIRDPRARPSDGHPESNRESKGDRSDHGPGQHVRRTETRDQFVLGALDARGAPDCSVDETAEQQHRAQQSNGAKGDRSSARQERHARNVRSQ